MATRCVLGGLLNDRHPQLHGYRVCTGRVIKRQTSLVTWLQGVYWEGLLNDRHLQLHGYRVCTGRVIKRQTYPVTVATGCVLALENALRAAMICLTVVYLTTVNTWITCYSHLCNKYHLCIVLHTYVIIL